MSDKTRFKKRRQLLAARGLCRRCGHGKAEPGHTTCKKCVTEILTKRLLRPAQRLRCEKIGRLERKLALFREAEKETEGELQRLRSA